MAKRRNTTNRLKLIRACETCGEVFVTTADTPFIRQLPNLDGKKQKTCYFCSEKCFGQSYIHKGFFDGMAEQRRRAKEARRDIHEKNRRYYAAHAAEERARARARYWRDPKSACADMRYQRQKKRLLEAEA